MGRLRKPRYLSVLCLMLILSTPVTGLSLSASASSNTQTSAQGCLAQLQSAVSRSATLDTTSAISLAENYQYLPAYTGTSEAVFSSVFNSWSWDSSCNVTWESVNVVLALWGNSKFVGYAVVTENPTVNQVLNVTVQRDNPSYVQYYTKSPWSGYEFAASADQTANVWETIATWTIPTPSDGYQYECDPAIYPQIVSCNLGVWTGLVHTVKGSSGIAQDGTGSNVVCSGSPPNYVCSRGYYLWYLFFGQQSNTTECLRPGDGVKAGDSIYAYVLNQAANPGGNSNYYNLLISDNTINKACTVSNYYDSSIGTPHYGEFMAEQPPYRGLPKFTTYSMAGSMFYGGTTHGVYSAYSHGWYTQYAIQNCIFGGGCYTNTQNSAVSSSNTFSETWLTSQASY